MTAQAHKHCGIGSICKMWSFILFFRPRPLLLKKYFFNQNNSFQLGECHCRRWQLRMIYKAVHIRWIVGQKNSLLVIGKSNPSDRIQLEHLHSGNCLSDNEWLTLPSIYAYEIPKMTADNVIKMEMEWSFSCFVWSQVSASIDIYTINTFNEDNRPGMGTNLIKITKNGSATLWLYLCYIAKFFIPIQYLIAGWKMQLYWQFHLHLGIRDTMPYESTRRAMKRENWKLMCKKTGANDTT